MGRNVFRVINGVTNEILFESAIKEDCYRYIDEQVADEDWEDTIIETVKDVR